MTLYFEDLSVGDAWTGGAYEVTEDEIIRFAERYDPQWFHTDPKRAEESIYGGLIAAGFHTAAISTRLLVEAFLAETATLGAKGIDELRWHRPVRPGDVLSTRAEIVGREADTERRGTVDVLVETAIDGDVAFSMTALVMVGRRSD